MSVRPSDTNPPPTAARSGDCPDEWTRLTTEVAAVVCELLHFFESLIHEFSKVDVNEAIEVSTDTFRGTVASRWQNLTPIIETKYCLPLVFVKYGLKRNGVP